MEIFSYTQKEIDYLKKKDKRLGEVITKIGMINREVIPDLFSALINSIIGQQIQATAAATIWKRIQIYFKEVTPEIIAKATVEEIQKCGLSTRKAMYIKGVGEAVFQNEINLSELTLLPDIDVIAKLSSIKGIGTWTSEMLLIFSMQRPNILSFGDLAIQRGIMKLYNLKTLSKEQFEKYRKRYSPYASIASLYLWELSKYPMI